MVDSLGQPYDYYSRMHYAAKYFSKNGLETLRAKQPGIKLDRTDELSAIDIRKLNIMGNCGGEFCKRILYIN